MEAETAANAAAAAATASGEVSKSAAKKAAKMAQIAEKKKGKTPNAKSETTSSSSSTSSGAATISAKCSANDNVHAVGKSVIDEVIQALTKAGVSIPDAAKSDAEDIALSSITPILTSLKNTAYSKGFNAHCDTPIKISL